jgi:hypothetical protein
MSKNTLLLLKMSTCGHCHHILDDMKNLGSKLNHLNVLIIDASNIPDALKAIKSAKGISAKKLLQSIQSAHGFPTLLCINENADTVSVQTGYIPPKELLKFASVWNKTLIVFWLVCVLLLFAGEKSGKNQGTQCERFLFQMVVICHRCARPNTPPKEDEDEDEYTTEESWRQRLPEDCPEEPKIKKPNLHFHCNILGFAIKGNA